jgi:lysophospholipase L1-like esterase
MLGPVLSMTRIRYGLGLMALALAFSCGVAVRHYSSPLLGPLVRSIWAPAQQFIYNPIMVMAGRTSVYESTPGTADVVMLGDSLTDWGNWHELLPNHNLINRGIAGDTSSGVLARIAEVIERKPKLVVLMIGVNDILEGSSPEAVTQNIRRIVRSLQEKQIRVILQSVVLMSPGVGSRANPHIARLNRLLHTTAAEESIRFLDLNPTLAPSGTLHPDVTRDGLHLAGRGYVLWAEALRPLLQSKLG